MTPFDLNALSAGAASWLLTYAVHSTILLGAALAIAARLADEHAWLDRIWKAALVGPIVTASLQVSAGTAPLTGRWPIAGGVISSPHVIGEAPAVPPAASRPSERRDVSSASHVAKTRRIDAVASSAIAQSLSDRAPQSASRFQAAFSVAWQAVANSWPLAVVSCWMAIAATRLSRFLLRLRRVHRTLRQSRRVAPAPIRQAAETLWPGHLRSACPIKLAVTQRYTVPLAMAGRWIVLPERFLAQLDDDQQRAAIAHEMAHVVRRDPAWRIVAGVIERVLFFQPLNGIARVRLCEAAEFLCDQWALERTRAPLALARSLSAVAAWASSAGEPLPAAASPMAHRDSPLVRRVTRILDEGRQPWQRPSVAGVLAGLALVAFGAPMVSANAAAERGVAPVHAPRTAVGGASPVKALIGGAVANPALITVTPPQPAPQLRVLRPPQPDARLGERWRWALAEADRLGIGDFWVVYSFETPTHAGELMMSDTEGVTFVNGRDWVSQGPSLDALLGQPSGSSGNVTALFHYHAARTDAIDRGGYRSTRLGFEFGRSAVFSLGVAAEEDSFARLVELFDQASRQTIKVLAIELVSLHPTSNLVLPFLTRAVEPTQPAAIREEAAEGFNNHHDPRSVEVLVRVARTDPSIDVRVEAAETIGEVQTPTAVPALTDLATNSPDQRVRAEAAEAYAGQPPDLALPALERLIAQSADDEVLVEALEALGELPERRGLALLSKTASGHPRPRAQQEAVETLGDIGGPEALAALVRIVWNESDLVVQREAVETLGDLEPAPMAELERIVREHPSEDVQAQAIETLGDLSAASLNPAVIDAVTKGKTARIRLEAIEAIAELAAESTDTKTLDAVERAVEQSISNDPDRHVQMEALEALDELPRDRALRVLQRVIDRHPDADIRREALDLQRDRHDSAAARPR